MKLPTAIRLITSTALLLGLAAPVQLLHAQGTGKATMSVGITIVAPTADTGAPADPRQAGKPRIPVDPAYAIRHDDPLRDARVERVATPDGRVLQVVSY